MEKQIIIENLIKNNYNVHWFDTSIEAVSYLVEHIKGKTVGFGDSQTLAKMRLHESLEQENIIYDPLPTKDTDEFLEVAKKSLTADIFLTSVNGMSETGVLVNLDGTGNRVAGSLFGHEKVYFIIGTNKVAPNLEEAIQRVRNIAAPRNAHRLKLRTPCAIRGDRCYDCKSPDRICNGLMIYYKKMNDIDMEVIMVDEPLGY